MGLVGLCSTTGCSFLFVHGPPPDHERLAYFDCSSSNVLPVLDAVYAGAAGIEAAVAATGSRTISPTSSARTDAFVLAGEAAIIGASAVYGFSKTSDCRKAQAAMLKRAATQGPTFGPGASPTFAPPGAPAVDPWTGRPIGAPQAPPAPPPAPAPAPATAP